MRPDSAELGLRESRDRNHTGSPSSCGGLRPWVWACAFLAFVAPVAEPASGISRELTPEDQARNLVRVVEGAQEIVTGTITDTTAFLDAGWVWTRYTVAVDSVIKGNPPDTPLTFVAEGGSLRTRSPYVEHGAYYRIGERWLLFLTDCTGAGDRRTLTSGLGHISGDSIKVNRQGDCLHTPTFLESIRALVDHCSVGFQKAGADVVIVGTIDTPVTIANDYYYRALTRVRGTVIEVLFQTGGPRVQPQEQFTCVAAPTEYVRSSRAEKPVLREAETYVLFMQRTGSSWELNRSMYSAWRRVDSLGVVEALGGYPCAAGDTYFLARMPWADLLESLRSP